MYNPNTTIDALEFEPADLPVQPETSPEKELPTPVKLVLDIGRRLNEDRAIHLDQQELA